MGEARGGRREGRRPSRHPASRRAKCRRSRFERSPTMKPSSTMTARPSATSIVMKTPLPGSPCTWSASSKIHVAGPGPMTAPGSGRPYDLSWRHILSWAGAGHDHGPHRHPVPVSVAAAFLDTRRPVGFHAHEVRLRRGLLVAGAVHAPTAFRSALLAVRLTLPYGGEQYYSLRIIRLSHVLACQPPLVPHGGPPLRSGRHSRDNGAPRLGGPADAPVAPRSLRSLVRPRQCARRPAMSLGPGVRTARAPMK